MATPEPDRTVLLRVAERLCDVAVEIQHRALTIRSAATTMRWESQGAAAFRDSVDDTTATLRAAAEQFVAAADRLRCLYVSLTPTGPASPFPAIGAIH